MAAFLVTGGAGFIGSHLVEALVARGHAVRVLDNFSTGRLDNLAAVQDRVEIVATDLKERDAVFAAARDVECIFHFAAPGSGTYDDLDHTTGGWRHPADTVNVLLAAREAGVRRVVYASTGGVYSHPRAVQMKEGDPVLPLTPEAIVKLSAEHECVAFTSLYGLETVRLRYFEVFGPRQSASSPHAAVIPTILKAVLAGLSPVLVENVYERRDYLYVDDAVHTAVLAAEASRASATVYNIGRGRSANALELVDLVNQIRGTTIRPVCSPAWEDDCPPITVSIARAESELGFCPQTDLRQGLKAFINHYARQAEQSPLGGGQPLGEGPHVLDKNPIPPTSRGDGQDPVA
jgi:UDP-glucose 4-epimerase